MDILRGNEACTSKTLKHTVYSATPCEYVKQTQHAQPLPHMNKVFKVCWKLIAMVAAAEDERMETTLAAALKQTHPTPLADEEPSAFQHRLYSE